MHMIVKICFAIGGSFPVLTRKTNIKLGILKGGGLEKSPIGMSYDD